MIGDRIRALREQCNMTLNELAQTIGLSASAVSQIERGIVEPSLRTLRALASALDTPIFSFFLESPSHDILVRKGRRLAFSPPDRKARYELVTPDFNRRLEMMLMYLNPGTCSSDEPLPHTGDECLVVLQGEAQVLAAGQRYTLYEGDSLYLAEGTPHKVTNASDDQLVCAIGVTPPSF